MEKKNKVTNDDTSDRYHRVYKYEGDLECDELMKVFTRCALHAQKDAELVCADERQAYLDCRKKWNEIYRHQEERVFEHTKMLYFFDPVAMFIHRERK